MASYPKTEDSRQKEQIRVEVVALFMKNRVDFDNYFDKVW